MGYKGTEFSRSAYFRKLKKAKELGCNILEVPDMRGCHENHPRKENHPRWNGGKPDPIKRLKNSKMSQLRHPERVKARDKVHYAVKKGSLLHPTKCLCVDCGNKADSYDHFNGYDYPLDVEAVCFKCHGKRSKIRGEHSKKHIQPIPEDLMIREYPK